MLREQPLKERIGRSFCFYIQIAPRYLLLICIARIGDKLTTLPAFLQQIAIRGILKPEIYHQYEHTIQDAYDAFTTVEDALTALGMKLEYQHYRLGGAIDELKPLLIQPRSKADTVMEAFHKQFP